MKDLTPKADALAQGGGGWKMNKWICLSFLMMLSSSVYSEVADFDIEYGKYVEIKLWKSPGSGKFDCRFSIEKFYEGKKWLPSVTIKLASEGPERNSVEIRGKMVPDEYIVQFDHVEFYQDEKNVDFAIALLPLEENTVDIELKRFGDKLYNYTVSSGGFYSSGAYVSEYAMKFEAAYVVVSGARGEVFCE